jgi:hypothetical protein
MALHRVKLQWGITVEASSQREAHAKVVSLLRQHPEAAISGVEDPLAAKPRSLLARLWTGK